MEKTYKGIDYTQVRPVFKPKNPEVKDPPRFPKVLNPLEDEMKKEFTMRMNMTIVDVTKAMVNIAKSKG